MSKIITQDQVKSEVESRGYRLVGQWERATKKLHLVCSKGHDWHVLRGNFLKPRHCPYCEGSAVNEQSAKMALGEIGYTLLSDYLPTPAKITVRCDRGHVRSTTYLKIISNKCKECFADDLRFSHDFVDAEFRKVGYTLLTEYKKNSQKLDFICDKNHRHQITFAHLRTGGRCGVCDGKHLTHEDIKSAFEKKGWSLHSTYIAAAKDLDVTCPNGHRHKKSWNNFQQKAGCRYCSGSAVWEPDIHKAFNDAGWVLHSKFSKSHSKMALTCDKGHQVNLSWSDFRVGHRCAVCASGGFKSDKPGSLYYIRFDSKAASFYKIGITNFSPKKRFRDEKTPYKVLMEKRFLFGFLAYQEEQKILKKYKKYQYNGPLVLESGNTELFVKDVLGMDKAG